MDWYFWIFATIALGGALFTITYKDVLPCAMGLLTVFIAMAALYLHLNAPLVAVFQVTIYAGAILVLVLFVVMLLMSPGEKIKQVQANCANRFMGAVLTLALIILLGIGTKGLSQIIKSKELPEGFGTPSQLGDILVQKFILHFEVVSILLLAALVGAIYLAKKRT